MEIDKLQHPDSIWTWKTNSRRGKASLWLPYLSEVKSMKGDKYCFTYNGGSVEARLRDIDFIMLYGASGDLPVAFLDALNNQKIPLIIHRRNLSDPYLFLPTYHSDRQDILTAQIVARQNQIKAVYIARNLLKARIAKMAGTINVSGGIRKSIMACRSIIGLRSIEAQITKRYWKAYYGRMGIRRLTRRDRNEPINQALNAGSLFLSGVILRWVLYHRLSPQHGFLHVQSSYPSLVYDLIEPFRFVIEEAALQASKETSEKQKLVAYTIEIMKDLLEEQVYVPATRQQVRRKNTIHGAVLALRAYLIGDMSRFVLPMEGAKTGGRPIEVSYKLPGEIRK